MYSLYAAEPEGAAAGADAAGAGAAAGLLSALELLDAPAVLLSELAFLPLKSVAYQPVPLS